MRRKTSHNNPEEMQPSIMQKAIAIEKNHTSDKKFGKIHQYLRNEQAEHEQF